MAMGRGQAEVVLTPVPVPLKSKGAPSSPRGVPAAAEGPAAPLCPPRAAEPQSRTRGEDGL